MKPPITVKINVGGVDFDSTIPCPEIGEWKCNNVSGDPWTVDVNPQGSFNIEWTIDNMAIFCDVFLSVVEENSPSSFVLVSGTNNYSGTLGRKGLVCQLKIQDKATNQIYHSKNGKINLIGVTGGYTVDYFVVDPDKVFTQPYHLRWKVTENDLSNPVINSVEIKENGNVIPSGSGKEGDVEMIIADQRSHEYTLWINGQQTINTAKVIYDSSAAASYHYSFDISPRSLRAVDGNDVTVKWKVEDDDPSNPIVDEVTMNLNNQLIPNGRERAGEESAVMGSATLVYHLLVTKLGGGILIDESKTVQSVRSNRRNFVLVWDVPDVAVIGQRYHVKWKVDPSVASVDFMANGVVLYSNDGRKEDDLQEMLRTPGESITYQLVCYDAAGTVIDSKSDVTHDANVTSRRRAPNNPSNTITLFEIIGGNKKRKGDTFTVSWAVQDSPNSRVTRSITLRVDGSSVLTRSHRLTGTYDQQMRDHPMMIELIVYDDSIEYARAVPITVTSEGVDSQSLKEKLINGVPESTLRKEGVSQQAIDNAWADIEADRRIKFNHQYAGALYEKETERMKMEKEHGAGNFWGDILKLQMKNVSAENAAYQQHAAGQIGAARQTAKWQMDKNTADIRKADNLLEQERIKADKDLKLKEMELAAKAGKGGPMAVSATRSPLTPGGLDSFVGSLVDEGKRQQESGEGLRNPLNMDMGGIVPRLPEREEDSMLDRTANNSLAAFNTGSLGTINQTTTGLRFGGVPGMTSTSASILNPSSLNSTMNRVSSSLQNTVPHAVEVSQTRPAFSSADASQMQRIAINGDPLKGMSAEKLDSMGLVKKYVDQISGHRMPADPNTTIFTSETGAKYYYDKKGSRGVGRPPNTASITPIARNTVDSIVQRGAGNPAAVTQAPVNDFAFGQEDIYGKMEKENVLLNSEYGKAMPEFDLKDEGFADGGSTQIAKRAGVNIIDPSKMKGSGSVDVANMLSGIL